MVRMVQVQGKLKLAHHLAFGILAILRDRSEEILAASTIFIFHAELKASRCTLSTILNKENVRGCGLLRPVHERFLAEINGFPLGFLGDVKWHLCGQNQNTYRR